MMWRTAQSYKLESRLKEPEAQFKGNYPEWRLLDYWGSTFLSRILFGIGYVVFYIVFATHWWMFLLLPIHFMMGPIQGAIVNWCIPPYSCTLILITAMIKKLLRF